MVPVRALFLEQGFLMSYFSAVQCAVRAFVVLTLISAGEEKPMLSHEWVVSF